jgi:hyperosmotically inducible periplasmic protein
MRQTRWRSEEEEENMPSKRMRIVAALGALLLAGLLPSSWARQARQERDATRLVREVRHEIVMLPYFGVFDSISFRIEGNSVTLLGQVVRPTLKSDAERVVKEIEGVEKVDNRIEVLPLSPADDRIRLAAFRAIYWYPALERYGLQAIAPIRIVVKNGAITLEGIMDTEADRNLAGILANGVPGAFSVTNNLQVTRQN